MRIRERSRLLAAGACSAAIVLAVPTGASGAAALQSTSGAASGRADQALVDSARAELAAARPWHAARLLAPAHPGLEPTGVLLLARAEAGWGNWSRVRSLLEGAPWLDREGRGEGWSLLARALEEGGEWGGAAGAWERYLASDHGEEAEDAPAVVARRSLALARSRGWAGAFAHLDALEPREPAVAAWLALELGRTGAAAGDVAEVRRVLPRIPETLRGRAWDVEPRALLAAGDTTAAEAALSATLAGIGEAVVRGEAWLLAGEIALARRDTGGARSAFREALAAGPPAGVAARAGGGLVELGGMDAATALAAARALERVGDARALAAYDRHAGTLAPQRPPPDVRLARARLLAGATSRAEEAAAELGSLTEVPEADVAALALDQLARLRERQGQEEEALALRELLLERFPVSVPAADVLFFRADAAHDVSEMDEALEGYRRLVETSPSQDRAGLARMRWGQIHLQRGEPAEAAHVFEAYLASFPDGARWEEATYWGARAHAESGDPARTRVLLADLRAREPFGYYALLAAELLGEPFRIEVPEGEVVTSPAWVTEGVRTLGLLGAAGLQEGRTAVVRELRARAAQAPQTEALALARELVARGHALEGINLGWELRDRGVPWSRRLLEVVYPLPEGERVIREARQWGADPWLVAAIVRQESAWEEAIRSSAGAIGLMQVMPETGRELFARHGGGGSYHPELLETGDLNLHLGTAYLVELLERYPGELPLALSAYNAGPHRADRWRAFPEAADPLRFTERIPFGETRDYVKRVTRNRVLYGALYGGR